MLFVLRIGAAAALALFASSSTRSATNLGAAQTSAEPLSLSNTAGPSFDRAKWNALVQYDKDIALMAEKLQPLGQKWLDEFASSYLVLNDKTYLPEIERKIVAAARSEAEQNKRQRIYAEEQRRAQVELWRNRIRATKKKLQLWRDRIWGNRQRKLLTVTCGVVVVLLATVMFWPKKYTNPFAYCNAVINIDMPVAHPDGQYIGPTEILSVGDSWRCMDGDLYGCNETTGYECVQKDLSTTPPASVREYCSKPHQYDMIPHALQGNSSSWWRCSGTIPVIESSTPFDQFDKRGFYKRTWFKISH